MQVCLDGVPYTEEQMRNNKRINWDGYCRFLENVGRVWNDEELEEIGREHSRLNAYLWLVGRFLSPKDFLKWLYSLGSPFTCVDYSIIDLGENNMLSTLRMKEGYKPSREFFYISKGAIIEIIKNLNVRTYAVEMQIEENAAFYNITYTTRSHIISFIQRTIHWPFDIFHTGHELKETIDNLNTAYIEVVKARNILEIRVKERTAELKQAQEMRNRFFANISHEFRTPLTLIVGPLEKILSKHPDEETVKQAGLIKRNANRLLELINQLLDLSKLEAGNLRLKASPDNIVSFVKGVTMSFESIAERKDIALKVKSELEEIEVYFDKDMMAKILIKSFIECI